MLRLLASGTRVRWRNQRWERSEDRGFKYLQPASEVSHGNPRITHVGVPVILDGLYAEPGHIIHGDINGVLFVPRKSANQLPMEVDKVKHLERAAPDSISRFIIQA